MVTYIGRFAPSPTGSLHLGSLAAAVASYLDAKAHHGLWRVRIEDIDPPREVAGSAQNILSTLQQHGLHWDGEILYQSTRLDAYENALLRLQQQNRIFACGCSRSELSEQRIYPGTCRHVTRPNTNQAHAWRVKTDSLHLICSDRIQPQHSYQLDHTVGDFIVRRKDGFFAYQLAVVVDDAEQGVTHIVRGCDLLDSTPRQMYLQQLLGLPHPQYAHIPLVVHNQQKLSKQNLAPALDSQQPIANLRQALIHLNQPIPAHIRFTTPEDLLSWAYQHWDLSRLRSRS